jgi:Asp-tRNA(Asn)/Glu-tRNA(Gln) amidotransferase A subunit family amidase
MGVPSAATPTPTPSCPISHTRDTVGPLGRTVADVALLDSFITQTAMAQPASLQGVRLGVPAALWAGLDASVAPTAQAAKAKLAAAGAVLVDMDIPGLFSTNDLISFQVALHEPIADIPAYLAASGLSGLTIASIASAVVSPDVQGAFGAIQADVFGAAYPDAINIHRPILQKLYADAFATHKVEALLFPTTLLAATPMDLAKGSSTVSVNGGSPVDTFGTYIRNTDPGSNAGIPGLSVPAGLNAAGLPVGMELDGPLGSDQRLLSLGLALEAVLGRMPAPKL